MIRFYILPLDRTSLNQRGPKYFDWKYDPDPPGIICPWSMIDYGSIDMAVLATDILQADHDALILHNDVYTFPSNLDVVMAQTERSNFNAYLEANFLPGDWISAGITFREALRTITGIMRYITRVTGILGYPQNPFTGLTLNTQYRNIPNPLHDAMAEAATGAGYAWAVSPNDQVRKIFKYMSDQWVTTPTYFGNLGTL